MNSLLTNLEFTVKVSSVLNRNVKEFGKKFLFDGREDTCWNSDQGKPQWIKLDFNNDDDDDVFFLKELWIQFQGGFVGQNCRIYVDNKENRIFYPEDSNSYQTFKLDPPLQFNSKSVIKIVFEDSTDFFGRITVYRLDLV